MKHRWKLLRWLLGYPILIVGGCQMLLTGSPIPLCHLENLDAPVPVSSVTEDHLVLQGGRNAKLPFIRRIPQDNPLFKAAIANGVEVTSDGDAFGLMWLDPFCGNDPTWWRRIRINLTDLAAALQPEGIEDSALNPETMDLLLRKENGRINLSESSSHDRGHLTHWDVLKVRRIRKEINDWVGRRTQTSVEESRDAR